ncbi:MAG: phosphate ABC transporter permease PstA [Planctomycetes bacterium]|nr:phosphate ABC transporter permease PstA [Planctomycetota bacterium]
MSKLRDSFKKGEPAVLLTAAGLAAALLLLGGMVVLVAVSGLGVFWPKSLVQFETKTGKLLGEVMAETIAEPRPGFPGGPRFNLRVANRDIYAADFMWVNGFNVVGRTEPADAWVVERLEYGNFHGFLSEVRTPEGAMASSEAARTDAFDKAVAASEKDTKKGPEIVFTTADGKAVVIHAGAVVDAWQPNRMGTLARTGHYVAALWNFLTGNPRESNTEGGIWPALFGTCLMVLLMSVAVVPFGVMAAVYLHEYARQGVVVRLVRIAVSNLAGVPSIVFGLFGLGFFVYTIGGSIDRAFFSDSLPTPTFGTGGILWASLTLALLTLPVVIVATEEALAAVPHANREGALALGSTKWEMLRRVVLPNAMPGILTGMILAVARGAGEVAPLMLTGAVKLAPKMPFDADAPFFHLDRKFMHLGFHIYDLGFQSPNVEAAKPMVYATTLLLIIVVVALNVTAIVMRARLRKRLEGHAF